jgi:hypothetical protein
VGKRALGAACRLNACSSDQWRPCCSHPQPPCHTPPQLAAATESHEAALSRLRDSLGAEAAALRKELAQARCGAEDTAAAAAGGKLQELERCAAAGGPGHASTKGSAL